MGALAFVEYPPFLFPQFYSLKIVYPHPHFLLSPQPPKPSAFLGVCLLWWWFLLAIRWLPLSDFPHPSWVIRAVDVYIPIRSWFF